MDTADSAMQAVPPRTTRKFYGKGGIWGWWEVIGEPFTAPPAGGSRGRPVQKMLCQCRCGMQRVLTRTQLSHDHTRSCGECGPPPPPNTTHGHSGKSPTTTYKIWNGMRQRCGSPKASGYESYGGRGVKVCARWASFQNFLLDMGERPPGKSIDRINGMGDYEPENCRWATPKEQSRNTISNRTVAYNGVSKTVAEWSEELGIHRATLVSRIERGWGIAEAFTTPCGKYVRR